MHAADIGTATRPVKNPDLFKTVASHWPSGVAVITTVDERGNPHGLTMSAVMSLSVHPMQYLISVDMGSTTLPLIKKSGRFCINFLSKAQTDVCTQFATKSADKFGRISYRLTNGGLPLIDGAVSCIDCEVHSIVPGGDHEIIIGDVVDIEHFGGEPLIHFKRSFHKVVPS